MNNESVIITTLTIDKPQQTKLFQVRVSREVKNIIGVEMGLTWLAGTYPATLQSAGPWTLPLGFTRNLCVGEVKLQSYEQSNIFYTGELLMNRNNDNADFSSRFFTPQAYTHQMRAHEDDVLVNGRTTLIQGVYRDKLFNSIEGNYRYTVKLYLWTEAKEATVNQTQQTAK
ncbi:MAG: hypothetical protein ACXVP0_18770 [Bacteroidia bacterium]